MNPRQAPIRGPMSESHKAAIRATAQANSAAQSARMKSVWERRRAEGNTRRRQPERRQSKTTDARLLVPIAKLLDSELVAEIIKRSELAADVQREMIESTLALHVDLQGADEGHKTWRRSMEDICHRGRAGRKSY